MKTILYLIFILLSLNVIAQEKDLEKIYRVDARLNRIVPLGSQVEKVAGGFRFVEGPVWVKNGGFLLFSDIPNNVIHKWHPTEGLSIFLQNSGYTGEDDAKKGKGSNGLALDSDGDLLICQHGNRAIVRLGLAKESPQEILVENYLGKKLNSPNDIVVASDGSMYFTDPPYGLDGGDKSPEKEIGFQGIYHLEEGKITLLDSTFSRPNGIGLSPDKKTLYVANSGSSPDDIYWAKFKIKNGELGKKQLFYEGSSLGEKKGTADGLAIDIEGNLYCTGPGGIVIFSEKGEHLGTISFPEVPSNCAFGGKEGKTLYVTARSGLYKIKLGIEGLGFN